MILTVTKHINTQSGTDTGINRWRKRKRKGLLFTYLICENSECSMIPLLSTLEEDGVSIVDLLRGVCDDGGGGGGGVGSDRIDSC